MAVNSRCRCSIKSPQSAILGKSSKSRRRQCYIIWAAVIAVTIIIWFILGTSCQLRTWITVASTLKITWCETVKTPRTRSSSLMRFTSICRPAPPCNPASYSTRTTRSWLIISSKLWCNILIIIRTWCHLPQARTTSWILDLWRTCSLFYNLSTLITRIECRPHSITRSSKWCSSSNSNNRCSACQLNRPHHSNLTTLRSSSKGTSKWTKMTLESTGETHSSLMDLLRKSERPSKLTILMSHIHPRLTILKNLSIHWMAIPGIWWIISHQRNKWFNSSKWASSI